MKLSISVLTRVCSALVLAGSFLAANGWAQTAKTEAGLNQAEGASPKTGAAASINISFKVDPRLSGPTYGGERWISPRIFTGAAAQTSVQAKVEGVDANGRPVKISPTWTPADPDMVEVSPSEGSAVNITVKHAGTTTLALAVPGGVSRQLSVHADVKSETLQIRISQ